MNARTCPPKKQGGRTPRPSLWGEPAFSWNLPDGKRKKNTTLVTAGKRRKPWRGRCPLPNHPRPSRKCINTRKKHKITQK
jgi:hypothetical protein